MGKSNVSALLWRITVPLVILLLATICFQSGVGVAYQPHVVSEGLLMHILHAVSLFKVAGLELGEPVSGPTWAMVTLYVMYFAAPAVSVGAILEAVFRVARLKLRWVLSRGNHVVIIGAGRATVHLPEIINEALASARRFSWFSRRAAIVLADKSEESLLRHSTDVLKLQLDASDSNVPSLLSLHRARVVFIITDDDQANIDLYFRVRESLADVPEEDHPLIFIRVRDMDLIRVLRSYNTTLKTRFFNVHIEAVRALFTIQPVVERSRWLSALRSNNDALSRNWDALVAVKTLRPKRIVMLGFGRFGQHLLLEMLQRDNGAMVEHLESLVVICPDVFRSWAHFERLLLCNVDVQRPLPNPEMTNGTHADIGLLHATVMESQGVETLWIIGTDDTAANIQAASVLQRFCGAGAAVHGGHTTLIVRTHVFSMAYDRLLMSAKTDAVDHVILPTYHILGAYFQRRMDDAFGFSPRTPVDGSDASLESGQGQ